MSWFQKFGTLRTCIQLVRLCKNIDWEQIDFQVISNTKLIICIVKTLDNNRTSCVGFGLLVVFSLKISAIQHGDAVGFLEKCVSLYTSCRCTKILIHTTAWMLLRLQTSKLSVSWFSQDCHAIFARQHNSMKPNVHIWALGNNQQSLVRNTWASEQTGLYSCDWSAVCSADTCTSHNTARCTPVLVWTSSRADCWIPSGWWKLINWRANAIDNGAVAQLSQASQDASLVSGCSRMIPIVHGR